MPTPDDIDAAPDTEYAYGDHPVTLTPWVSSTYDGRYLASGRWIHARIGQRSLGLVQVVGSTTFYAFDPVRVGRALGDEAGSLDDAVRSLLRFVD